MLPLLFALAAASLTPLGNVSLTPLDAYVSTIDPLYKWHDTGVTVKFPLLKSTAHILNVTSQSWLTTKEAIGPNGNIWTHQVAVVIPQKLTSRGTATAVLTGGCNEDRTHGGGPKPPPHDEEYMELAATIADKTGVIVIVVYQIPNCHILYPSDPTQKHRSEDAMIAWAWRQYLDSKLDDPRLKAEWLPRLPMVKAGFACMKAAEEYVATGPTAVVAASEAAAIAAGASVSAPFQVKGWVVGGASKRGWTTWMVGAVAAQCAWCPKVIGITPLVPIVPFLNHSIHMQRRSLDGFTFAFRDYLDAGTVTRFDTPEFEEAMQIVDPGYYRQRLAAIPKLAVVSSDDEFMQLDCAHARQTLALPNRLSRPPPPLPALASALALGTLFLPPAPLRLPFVAPSDSLVIRAPHLRCRVRVRIRRDCALRHRRQRAWVDANARGDAPDRHPELGALPRVGHRRRHRDRLQLCREHRRGPAGRRPPRLFIRAQREQRRADADGAGQCDPAVKGGVEARADAEQAARLSVGALCQRLEGRPLRTARNPRQIPGGRQLPAAHDLPRRHPAPDAQRRQLHELRRRAKGPSRRPLSWVLHRALLSQHRAQQERYAGEHRGLRLAGHLSREGLPDEARVRLPAQPGLSWVAELEDIAKRPDRVVCAPHATHSKD